MQDIDIDFVFVARFQPKSNVLPLHELRNKETPIERWMSIYGTLEDAYRGAAVFIRSSLLRSNIAAQANPSVMQKIREAIRAGNIEDVISLWNEEVPSYRVKVYQGPAL